MKSFKTYLLIGLLTITIAPATAFAQSQAIDANRMNRDIRIMENILGELFRTQISPSGSNQTFVVSGTGTFHGDNVRGTYLPGFGVIFNVGNTGIWGSTYRVLSGSGDSEYTFYYDAVGSDKKKEEVDQESITARIQSFLRDYATTIGQLKDDEKVMVIFGAKSNSQYSYARLLTGRVTTATTTLQGQDVKTDDEDEDEKEEIPVISVSTKVSDLKEFRTGRINADKFEDRLAVATSKDREYLDLKVMGNIFETALRDQKGDGYRLSGNVSYLMLDNFGALFSLSVRYGTGSNRFAGTLTSEFMRVTTGYDNDKEKEEYQEYLKVVTQAFEDLKRNVSEYIVDYGRTLSSVNSEQYLLLSITLSGRLDEIPERIDVQIKKSALDQLDRGSITREAALRQIVITEY